MPPTAFNSTGPWRLVKHPVHMILYRQLYCMLSEEVSATEKHLLSFDHVERLSQGNKQKSLLEISEPFA